MDSDTQTVTIRPGPLGRLRLLSLRVEGAREVAQVALDRYEELRKDLDQALTDACADEGMAIPPGQAKVSIDWQTGVVSKDAHTTNGLVPQEAPI